MVSTMIPGAGSVDSTGSIDSGSVDSVVSVASTSVEATAVEEGALDSTDVSKASGIIEAWHRLSPMRRFKQLISGFKASMSTPRERESLKQVSPA